MTTSGYAIGRKIERPFGDVVDRVRNELKAEGFGVLSEIDVQAALREKLGEEVEPYLILGACNPQLAHRGLQLEPDLGVLLPCNVVVRRDDGVTYVSAMEPLSALESPVTLSSGRSRRRQASVSRGRSNASEAIPGSRRGGSRVVERDLACR